ncbi:MAG TPA: TIGR03668 family PPOX class F420-dependent oxidoreductase [Acidimicrobiales bacterium]
MTDDEAMGRFARARVARLATVDRDARPHIVPVCFAVVPGTNQVVSVIDDKPKRRLDVKRLANVAANPFVELVVDHYSDDWSTLWWVRVAGIGHVIDAGPSRTSAVDLLAEKYEPYRERRPSGAVLAIDIERVRHWEAR